MPIDYKKYHPRWKKISQFIRFYRAKNKCEKCGVENYSVGWWVDGEFITEKQACDTLEDTGIDLLENIPIEKRSIKIVLTVSHIDHDIKNNSFFNLMALCQRCHLKHDAKYHAQTRREKIYTNQLKLF